MLKKNRGFTLIELLIVIVIIGILAAIVVGLVATNSRNRANDARKKSIMREIQTALEQYKVDSDTYPAAGTWTTDLTSGNYLPAAPEVINSDAYTYALDANGCYTVGVDLDNDNDSGPNVVGTTDKTYELTCKQ